MTELKNSFKYFRSDSNDVFYTDLKASLKYSAKYDIVDDNEQIATLITNNSKTYSLTKYGNKLSIKVKWSWRNKWHYFIFENDNNLLATIYIHRPILFGFFRPDVFNIKFEETSNIFSFTKRKKKDWNKYSNADFYYDFILNGEIKCSIINLKRTNGFYLAGKIFPHEGVIEFDDSINLNHILCFLQMLEINISFEQEI